jgi:hypothetical protein
MAVNKIDLKSLASDPNNKQNWNKALSRTQDAINRGADGFLFPVKRLTSADSPYSMNVNDATLICDTTGGSITIILLPALDWEEKRITVKKIIAANTVTVEGNSSETIDDLPDLAWTAQYECHDFVSEGGEVWIV